MIKISSVELRQLWLDFFQKNNHKIIPAHSLVPENDSSLLWINSGVAALKPYFSGEKLPPATNLTNSQKALRTNDIENVGLTSRHHTFFEMLGNFSINGYFKETAINLAYEFLMDVLKMDVSKIYITYYEKDEETYQYWLAKGVKDEHLFSRNRRSNFWDLGAGPCGPCTEIFYDRGLQFDPDKKGLELLINDLENDRFIEIWNIVFSQFNNDGNNNYQELVQKNIDTGAGLERIVAISQEANTNFDTDLFLPIIHEIEKLTTCRYNSENYFLQDPQIAKTNLAFKIIADHLRAVCLGIADNVKPSNNNRGYIIRMLIRRALKRGIDLKIKKIFLYQLVEIVQKTLPNYPFRVRQIADIIQLEEQKFIKTIFEGQKMFDKMTLNNQKISGEDAFRLFDTYGYPIEMTTELAKEKNITIDLKGFEQAFEKHRDVSRMNYNQHGMNQQIAPLQKITKKISNFIGYDNLNCDTNIVALMNKKEFLEEVKDEELVFVITQETSFYATSGGQKYDKGYLIQNGNKFLILDVFKDKFLNHVHVLKAANLKANLPIRLEVDPRKRAGAMRNHSATHLTFSALEAVLKHKFKQTGSSLDHRKLHLDFDHMQKPDQYVIQKIQFQVQEWIKNNYKSEVIYIDSKDIAKSGVSTLENEDYSRYGSKVRTVRFGDFSYELCGGTHVPNTAFIEDYLITSIESKRSGVFRLNAITGFENVTNYINNKIEEAEDKLTKLISKIQQLKKDYKIDYHKDLESIHEAHKIALDDYKKIKKTVLNKQTFDLNDVKEFTNFCLYFDFPAAQKLKQAAMQILKKYNKTAIIHFSGDKKDRILIVSNQDDSNAFLQKIIQVFQGKGGGKKHLAQGVVNKIVSYEKFLKVLKNA